MKVLFVCKASTHLGYGHFIRSKSLAQKFSHMLKYQGDVKLLIISPENAVARLVNDVEFDLQVMESEEAIKITENYDFAFFDMLNLGESTLHTIKMQCKYSVSISPIFDQMLKMDLFFHRTKYHNLQFDGISTRSYMGLEYAIIPDNCTRISTGRYEENLNTSHFPISISMGGGDAANKTLDLLKVLKHCKVPATFWVMLGEGYQHSYNDLINEIKKDSHHEVILAKTNRSMWQILQNCVLAILPGGVTTYEAAFAGLPTINIFDSHDQVFLVQELIESGVSILGGQSGEQSFLAINDIIEKFYQNRMGLMEMHLKSKQLIDEKGAERIFVTCREYMLKNG